MSTKQSDIYYLTHLLPEPAAGHITLAQCRVDGSHPEAILTNNEKLERDSFKSDSRRREYLSTRWLISQINKQMNIDTAKFALHKDRFGKPYGVYKGTQYHISIAHTDDHVLCGISPDCPLGVDMEPLDREVPDQIRSRILHTDESKTLQEVSTIRIWTIKEALVKLRGQGMRINLNECIITAVQNRVFTARFNNEKTAKICSFKNDNNWLAIAWNC